MQGPNYKADRAVAKHEPNLCCQSKSLKERKQLNDQRSKHQHLTLCRYILTIYTSQEKSRDSRLRNRYKAAVPGKRALGQKLIPVPMRDEFIEHINAAVDKLNYGDRSKLIRDAIVEK